MSRGSTLTARVYWDEMSPDISLESAHEGLDVVRAMTPWIREEQEGRALRLGSRRGYVNTDTISWPRFDADINIVMTDRRIVDNEVITQNGALNSRRLATRDEVVGMAFHYSRVNSRRVALINPCGMSKPELITAHEIGHLLGLHYVEDEEEGRHCQQACCVMRPEIPADGAEAAQRGFCDPCSEQFVRHVDVLRKAKSGFLALFGNAKIF